MASVKFLDGSKNKIFKIKKSQRAVQVENNLPFRIKFIGIQIPSYGANNVPPVGIAIIGFNNYIL
jgi:hypothetical protein